MDPFFFVAVAGNSFQPIDVVHKLSPTTRAVVGSGDTSYLGVTSDLGLLSRDADAIYLSIVNGIGAGTSAMDFTPPFAINAGVANTDWVYASVFNPYSAVRAYMGYGTFCDLHGPAVSSVALSSYITGSQYLSPRMLYRTGTNHIFVGNCGSDGVVRINTATGAVDDVVGVGAYMRALYYSADTDTLYVESSASSGTLGSVTAYDGETLVAGASFPSAGVASGGLQGHSIHIGGEVFIASEATTAANGRLWKATMSGAGSVSEFGSATTIARDPSTGYIWTPWRTGGGVVTPEGGSASLSGTYVLVYDPASETLIDSISLGVEGANFLSILYTGDGNGDGGTDGAGASSYPPTIPVPQEITTAPTPRALLATSSRPRFARAMQIDESAVEQVVWPPFTQSQYNAFKRWWETSLRYGGRWFSASWPSPRGQIPLLRRFMQRPSWQFIGGKGGGYWQTSATLEVRGRTRTAAGTAEDFFALREDGGFVLREDDSFVERE